MHVVRAGSGAPPLVFVHGFACSHGDWQAQLDHFSRRHLALACDLRGHGQTPAEPDEVSIETFAMDVAQLLEDENLSGAVLVGHSMGCRVVLEAALKAPARVGRLVLVDGSRMGQGDPEEAADNATAAIAVLGYAKWARQFFEAMFVASSDAKLKAVTVARAVQLPEAIGSALFPRMNAWDAAKMEDALKAVKVPTLVIQHQAQCRAGARLPRAGRHLAVSRPRAPARSQGKDRDRLRRGALLAARGGGEGQPADRGVRRKVTTGAGASYVPARRSAAQATPYATTSAATRILTLRVIPLGRSLSSAQRLMK
jgi:pimeloyl-ACP methyl ester carboxylesterase